MNTTVLNEIIAFLFGRKYYATIIGTKGIEKHEVCSFIFGTKEEAERHRVKLLSSMTYYYIETISFRSRKEYSTHKIEQNDEDALTANLKVSEDDLKSKVEQLKSKVKQWFIDKFHNFGR